MSFSTLTEFIRLVFVARNLANFLRFFGRKILVPRPGDSPFAPRSTTSEKSRDFTAFGVNVVSAIFASSRLIKAMSLMLDEAADNEKGDIMAEAVMSRTRENDLKETIRQFNHTAFELRDNAQLAKREVSRAAEQKIAEIRKCDEPLNQSRQRT